MCIRDRGGVVAYVSFIFVAASMRIAVRDLGSFWERSTTRTGYLLRLGPIHNREILDRELYRVADYNLDANRQVGMEIARRTKPGTPILVWGFEPGIYWLADRPPSTRYIYDVAQRVAWSQAHARAEMLSDLEKKPPQWIVVSWTGQLNEPVVKHLHDAVLTQFNFEYIYNRYFDPEKVKGLPYTPLRPARTETVAADASTASKTVAADPGVYFFDDFSTTPVGKKPLNWHSTLNNAGASSVVSELTGLPGHWASVAGFTVTPTQVKGPLPRDFSVSFDLVATRDYTWGARSMMFKLSKGIAQTAEESYLTVRFRPGFSGRDGEATVEGRLPGAPPGYFSGTKYAAVPGFSNNQQNNRIAVTVRKQGEMVQVFIGQAKIAEYPKAIPETLLFDAVSFHLQGPQPSPNDRMFISNVKIVKQ